MTNFAHPHESFEDAEVAESKVLEPKEPWTVRERVRPPWVPIKHGQTIPPPNEQKSNLHLTDEQVMKKRTEPIVNGSSAKPLSGAGTNQPDDFSFTKKTGGDF
jgi:hypothetical protein